MNNDWKVYLLLVESGKKMCTDVPGMNYRLISDFVVVLFKICLTGCLFFIFMIECNLLLM